MTDDIKPEDKPTDETPEAKALREALAEAEKWKALSRKNEDQAKSNAEKAKKFDEHEDANKSDLEREKARADAAEQRLADIDAKKAESTLREEVAKAKGFEDRKISSDTLRGSTKEELETHADQILALLPPVPAAPSADGQGKAGQPIGEGEMSADDIVAAVTAR
ncbi:hypothetical protein [Frondihabitans sp. VKM Ac-2883]|uniref:hypothetical protein n=1 Tax=Frondihabitans sp. VKM Ac-2883 TaxID=2783823 RepID=UPI00188CCE6D|nr:hypothetical protein [Frondihabitans sp. VKM Ac-2883]MBF4574682.1 hypothetical protein [Frondihabitans sp. VKM Ac-2883]